MREADPTAFSPLPLKEVKEVGRTEYRNYPIVESAGEKYVELPAGEKYGSIEQVASRLFKGIVNVADVVEGSGDLKGRFFSKVMPLEAVEADSTDDDIKADIAVLSGVCGDPDRGFERLANGKYSSKNVISDGRVAAYYDFGGLRPNMFDKSPNYIHYQDYTDTALQKMKAKLRMLDERLEGEAGIAFLTALCKDIDMDSIPHPLDQDITTIGEAVARFHDALTTKIHKMLSKVDTELGQRAEKVV